MRELADRMLILEDYRRAYDIYKNLAGKRSNRDPSIEFNLSEMIQLCLAMSKFLNIKIRSEPYYEIQKYAAKILTHYNTASRIKHVKYLIFLLYCMHTFRSFDKDFIKEVFYPNLKQCFNTGQHYNSLFNLMPTLVYEQ